MGGFGVVVCLFVCGLGLFLLRRKRLYKLPGTVLGFFFFKLKKKTKGKKPPQRSETISTIKKYDLWKIIFWCSSESIMNTVL